TTFISSRRGRGNTNSRRGLARTPRPFRARERGLRPGRGRPMRDNMTERREDGFVSRASTSARGLAMDAVHQCSSGHLGLPLGCAEIGAVLFGHALRYNPQEPRWINRARFVLSAGHGSMFLYGWLHLAGYALVTLDEV